MNKQVVFSAVKTFIVASWSYRKFKVNRSGLYVTSQHPKQEAAPCMPALSTLLIPACYTSATPIHMCTYVRQHAYDFYLIAGGQLMLFCHRKV